MHNFAPDTLTISVTSFQALFFFIRFTYLLRDLVWQEKYIMLHITQYTQEVKDWLLALLFASVTCPEHYLFNINVIFKKWKWVVRCYHGEWYRVPSWAYWSSRVCLGFLSCRFSGFLPLPKIMLTLKLRNKQTWTSVWKHESIWILSMHQCWSRTSYLTVTVVHSMRRDSSKYVQK